VKAKQQYYGQPVLVRQEGLQIKSASLENRPYFDYIDGLRCIAVLCVLLFHSGVDRFSGGFIGVDIFFVISGFLMTQILARTELNAANLYAFFAARLRRIFPAYIIMLVVVIGFACPFLLPDDLLRLAPGLITAPFFLSNFVFRAQANYFDLTQDWNPILHTWSLGVEWQFYLLFPLVFIAARRKAVSLWKICAVLAIASLFWSTLGAYNLRVSPTAAFFLLPARICEFMTGSFIAIGAVPIIRRKWAAEGLSLLGLALIFSCAILYDRKTAFPGPGIILPCLGAALIISCGGFETFVARLLSFSPVRLIGKASYSIYLWHWPLIVLYKYRFLPNGEGFRTGDTAFIITASILIGLGSWKFIETPFRKKRPGKQTLPHFPQPPVVKLKESKGFACAAAAIPLLAGVLILASHGWPQRFPQEVSEAVAGKTNFGWVFKCSDRGEVCHVGIEGAPTTFALLGDSHAAALAEGMDGLAKDAGKAGLLLAANACPPLLHLESPLTSERDTCRRTQAKIPQFLENAKPDKVFLHGRWQSYYEADQDAFELAVDEMFRYLHDRKLQVVVLGDVPPARANVPVALARQAAFGFPANAEMTREDYLAWSRDVNAFLSDYSKKYGFSFIDLGPSLCAAEFCSVAIEGKPLYFDQHHLSALGSQIVVERNANQLK
jgi:peptidoglycan/LPS O-acetylase OafA/YrhL